MKLPSILICLLFVFVSKNFCAQTPMSVSVVTTNYSCNPGTAKIEIEGGVSPFYYNWNNGFQGGAYQTGLGPGNYNVSVVDGNGKDTLINFTITEEKCKVNVSNSFSPNGDGINDTWGIGNWQNYPQFKLYVYNRWGQLVHSQKGEYVNWDGKQLGIDLPVGTYYYIFYYSGSDGDLEKGSVTIMR